MVFGSIEIWLMLPVILVIYYLLPSKYRWSILLLGSFAYLGYFSIPFMIYATIFGIANYFFGNILDSMKEGKPRKRVYQLFLVLNIGQLVVYKYIDFLTDNLNNILDLFHGHEIPYLKLLVPIGISYFTFQGIGYIINVYRRHEKPEKHLGHFLIYTLFFPKIISGPIERSERFLPQLKNPRNFSPEMFKRGTQLIMFGMIKKLVIAERLSIIVNNVYGNLDDYTGIALVMVMFLQTIYLYMDFSGYTDIAIGIANLFGLNLTDNFIRPFFSRTVSEYWRRWHMSLSHWCNDYIFKTIIFKRRRWGKKASVYGVFVTFLIIGIWHGAEWTFVIIGLLQGIAINYEFFTKRWRLRMGEKVPLWLNNSVSRFLTFTFLSFSHIFFFSHSLSDAGYFIGHMFDFKDMVLVGNNLGLIQREVIIVAIAIIVIFLIEAVEERGHDLLISLTKTPLWFKWLAYYVIIFLIIKYGMFATTNFIYFQF